jgi:hypothetical protein
MKQRLPLVLTLLAVCAAGLVAWLVLRDSGARAHQAAELEPNASAPLPDNQPLQLPAEEEAAPELPGEDAEPDQPRADQHVVAKPEYHIPDFTRVARGGAHIDIQLVDANDLPLSVNGFSASLWRAVGARWVREDAVVDARADVVRCVGLGLPGLEPTGLEPGNYEIVVTSESRGCARHAFSVGRGERRVERMRLPVWTRAVCFTFVHADGSPVRYLPWPPKVITESKDLEERSYPAIPGMAFRSPPTEPDPQHTGGGGGRGGGSGWVETRHKSDPPERYATDDGRWWVNVIAGCDNTVSFHFEEELWGQQSYSFTDDFTVTDSQTVVLNTAADFYDRVLNPGQVTESTEPGNRGILAPPAAAAFDPHTAPVDAGKTRLVLRVLAPCEVSVGVREPDGKRVLRTCARAGELHWIEFETREEVELEFQLPADIDAIYETLPITSGGVVYIERTLPIREVDLGALEFSPTLDAFAHAYSIEFALGRALCTTLHFQRADGRWRALERSDADLVPLRCTHTISGADRFHQPHNTYRTRVTDKGNSYLYSRSFYEADKVQCSPVTLTGEVPESDKSAAIAFRPRWENTLVLRAVAADGAGLPGAEGLIMEDPGFAVAEQVRRLSLAQPEPPRITRDNAVSYAAALESLDDTDASLRALIGEQAWEAFETREQRLWFARHGAWYHTRTRVSGDQHGYIVRQNCGLEPGKDYVLHLWANSRDDLRPDARIVFKASAEVTDLGAIELPAYED